MSGVARPLQEHLVRVAGGGMVGALSPPGQVCPPPHILGPVASDCGRETWLKAPVNLACTGVGCSHRNTRAQSHQPESHGL